MLYPEFLLLSALVLLCLCLVFLLVVVRLLRSQRAHFEFVLQVHSDLFLLAPAAFVAAYPVLKND